MPSQKRQLGDIGEKEAEHFLVKKGYRILDRNYRVKNIGEIDLVTIKNGRIVFIEVKTRNNSYDGDFPIQLSINPRKKKILKRMCEIYLMNKREHADKKWQVDGVFINSDRPDWDKTRIEHLENILWERYY